MTLNEVRTISWISLGSVAFGTRGNVFRRLRRVEGLVVVVVVVVAASASSAIVH